jgi:hypothetical protein
LWYASGMDKARENRARRSAVRRGLVLRKARRRDPGALDYGRFWLDDDETGHEVYGGRWGASIEDVEEFLRKFGREGR